MTQCQVILLHHNPSLVYSVLDQFEQSMIDNTKQQYASKTCDVIQSKRKLTSFIASLISIMSCDLSKVIVDFVSPPLIIIIKSYDSNILLSFYDHYVEFNRMDLLEFASKNFKSCKVSKTCFIQLFDEKEAKLLLSMNEMAKIYGFLTRLYCSAFPTAHHIHLFAKQRRGKHNINIEEEVKAEHLLMKMKSMNVLSNNNNNNNNNNSNNKLKNYHLTSFTSIKILSYLLSTIIQKNKIPPMMVMYDLMTKIRLKLAVVREIRSCNNNNKCITDLVDHILKSNQSVLRTSYTTSITSSY